MNKQDAISICEHELQCTKIAHVLCHHCPKMLCLEHIVEHNGLNIVRASELLDETNSLTEYLMNMNTKITYENARNKLNQWKKENLDKIENIYEYHSNEIDRLENDLNSRLNILKENIELTTSDLKNQISHLTKYDEISEKQLSPIEFNIKQLRQYLQSVQCELAIEIKDISYNNLFNLQNIFIYNHKLINNTKLQSYRKLSIENLKEFISSQENQAILWLDNEKKLHFIDEFYQTHLLTLPDIKSSLMDIKWCSPAGVFLILFQRYLLSFNPKTHQFTEISLNRYKNYPFHCICCLNDQSIYISYCTSGICIQLYKYSFDNNNNNMLINECIKQYDCLTNDKTEWISNMNTNSDSHIGLLIRKGSSIYRRFELRDKQLNIIKIIELDNDSIERFYPFQNSYWFVKSLLGKYYIYSTETGEYSLSKFDFPFGIQEFGMNTIVIGNQQGELIYRDI